MRHSQDFGGTRKLCGREAKGGRKHQLCWSSDALSKSALCDDWADDYGIQSGFTDYDETRIDSPVYRGPFQLTR